MTFTDLIFKENKVLLRYFEINKCRFEDNDYIKKILIKVSNI